MARKAIADLSPYAEQTIVQALLNNDTLRIDESCYTDWFLRSPYDINECLKKIDLILAY